MPTLHPGHLSTAPSSLRPLQRHPLRTARTGSCPIPRARLLVKLQSWRISGNPGKHPLSKATMGSCLNHRARMPAKPQSWRTSDSTGKPLHRPLPSTARMGSCCSRKTHQSVKPQYCRSPESTSKLCEAKQPPATGKQRLRGKAQGRTVRMAEHHPSRQQHRRRRLSVTLGRLQSDKHSKLTTLHCSGRYRSAQAACAASRYATTAIACRVPLPFPGIDDT